MILDPNLLQPTPIPSPEKLGFTIPYDLLKNGNSFKIGNDTIAHIYENNKLVRTIKMGTINQSDIQPNQKIVVFKHEKYGKNLIWNIHKAPFENTNLKIKIVGRLKYNNVDSVKVFQHFSTDVTYEIIQQHITVQILNIVTKVVLKCEKDDPFALLMKYSEMKQKISKVLDKIGILVEFENFSIENYN